MQIGTGHVRRCLVLSRGLTSRGHDVTFIWRDLGLDLHSMIAEAGFKSHRLPRPRAWITPSPASPPHAGWARVPWEADAEETIEAMKGCAPNVVIVDHYAFDSRWHRAVKTALGSRMVALDDLGDRPLDVDLLVDQNYSDDHNAKHKISRRFHPTVLGGPKFALLSEAYRERLDFVVRNPVESVGIFLGGSDPANHTALAMTAVRRALGSSVSIEIATTRANPHLPQLDDLSKADERLALSVDLPNLAAFFRHHDLQVGAGGGATWERCCIGAPTVAMAFASNHRPVLQPLDDHGVLLFSRHGDQDAGALADDILALANNPVRRERMSMNARLMVDGLGVRRVGDAIHALND